MLTHKLYFYPHLCVNLHRSVFIHTQAFYYVCWFNDHQNVPGSVNILLLNVSWSNDTDSSSDWLISVEQVIFYRGKYGAKLCDSSDCFRKFSNHKQKQQRKHFTFLFLFLRTLKRIVAFNVLNSFLTYKCFKTGHVCSQAAHFCMKILTLVICIFSVSLYHDCGW